MWVCFTLLGLFQDHLCGLHMFALNNSCGNEANHNDATHALISTDLRCKDFDACVNCYFGYILHKRHK